MSLYGEWQAKGQENRSQEEYNKYWNAYFAAETENYRKILANSETVYSGSVRQDILCTQRYGARRVSFSEYLFPL